MARFRIGNRIIDIVGSLSSSAGSPYSIGRADILDLFNVSKVSDIVNEPITQQKLLNVVGFSTFADFVNQNVSKSFLNLNNVENKSSQTIRNEITIDSDGRLSGVGTSGIVVNNEKIDKAHVLSKIGVASENEIKNVNVTLTNIGNSIRLNNGFTTHTATIGKDDIGLGSVANLDLTNVHTNFNSHTPATILSGVTIDTSVEGTVKVKRNGNPDVSFDKSHVGLRNVENKSSNDIRSEIEIDEDGSLLGIGTLGVVVSNEKVDAEHIRKKINVNSLDEIKNANVTKSSVGLGNVANLDLTNIHTNFNSHTPATILSGVTIDTDVAGTVKIKRSGNPDVSFNKSHVGLGSVENKSSNDIRGEITINQATGKLVGIGTPDVVVSNDKVDAAHIASKVGVSSVDELKNSSRFVSIALGNNSTDGGDWPVLTAVSPTLAPGFKMTDVMVDDGSIITRSDGGLLSSGANVGTIFKFKNDGRYKITYQAAIRYQTTSPNGSTIIVGIQQKVNGTWTARHSVAMNLASTSQTKYEVITIDKIIKIKKDDEFRFVFRKDADIGNGSVYANAVSDNSENGEDTTVYIQKLS